MPRSAAHSTRCAAYDGVSTAASGSKQLDRADERSVFPVPTGMWQRPIRSNAASAAPATNGPALYVDTIRCPALMPDAA